MSAGKSPGAKLYLASSSPRRKELISLIEWEFSSLSTSVDEVPLPGEGGEEYVKRIAQSKACAAASQAGLKGVIIAADTTVIDKGIDGNPEIFGKPKDQAEAAEMLRKLRGHSHQVLTAISILHSQVDKMVCDVCQTDVPMRDYSDEEIEAYVASGDPLDKAGSYAIQHAVFHPVERLQGCYANVMGLPLCHLTRSLTRLGISLNVDVPEVCQAALRYDCHVHSQILNQKVHDFVYC